MKNYVEPRPSSETWTWVKIKAPTKLGMFLVVLSGIFSKNAFGLSYNILQRI